MRVHDFASAITLNGGSEPSLSQLERGTGGYGHPFGKTNYPWVGRVVGAVLRGLPTVTMGTNSIPHTCNSITCIPKLAR